MKSSLIIGGRQLFDFVSIGYSQVCIELLDTFRVTPESLALTGRNRSSEVGRLEEIRVDHHYPNAVDTKLRKNSDAVRLQRVETQPVPTENPAATQRDGTGRAVNPRPCNRRPPCTCRKQGKQRYQDVISKQPFPKSGCSL